MALNSEKVEFPKFTPDRCDKASMMEMMHQKMKMIFMWPNLYKRYADLKGPIMDGRCPNYLIEPIATDYLTNPHPFLAMYS